MDNAVTGFGPSTVEHVSDKNHHDMHSNTSAKSEGKAEQVNKKSSGKKSNAIMRSRVLVHPIIEEVIANGIPVALSADGYHVGGFYAQNETGYCEVFEQADSSLVGINTQGKPFEIHSLRDLVRANAHAHEVYKKHHHCDLYHNAWFPLLEKEFRINYSLVERD